MIVVADSSPLIYLAALSDLELLRALFGEIQIPPAVWTEVVEQGAGFPVREAVLQAAKSWLKATPLQSPVRSLTGAASRKLHRGEVEVIQLGEQLRADVLLIDDRSAVLQARAMGFRVEPTIAIYIQAKRAGLVPSIKRRVDQLRDSGFRLTDRDYEAVLIAAGEL